MPRHPHQQQHQQQQPYPHLRRHPAQETPSTSTPPSFPGQGPGPGSRPTAPPRPRPQPATAAAAAADPRLLNAAAAASNAQSRSRAAQFQTPPSRTIPQLHPSSGPLEPADTVHPAQAAQAAIFSLFGRGVHGRPQRYGQQYQAQHPQQYSQREAQGLGGLGQRRRARGMGIGMGYTEGDDEEEGSAEESGEGGVDVDEYEEVEEDDEEEASFVDHHHSSGLGRRRGFTDRSRITVDPEGNEIEMSDEDMEAMVDDELEEVEDEEDEEEEEIVDEDVDEDEMMQDRERSPSPLPANLREISSLASWTVSTHKPGCGVAALRNPSPTQYWQSDGPQPHTLTLHFFKLVAVVKIRVYLDCEMDESYTPTKMTFLAGMGGNDVVEFATWEGEGPCGWVDVPLEGVGGRDGGWVRKKRRRRVRKGEKKKNSANTKQGSSTIRNDYVEDEDEGEGDETAEEEDDEDDPYAGNVLKAMVIQMRVIENHQNGKDTHVRGFQVFARDDERRRMGNAPSASADGRVRRHSARKSLRASTNDEGAEAREAVGDLDRGKVVGLEAPDWMGEPVIR